MQLVARAAEINDLSALPKWRMTLKDFGVAGLIVQTSFCVDQRVPDYNPNGVN